MLPIADCLIYDIHGPHDWCYTPEGGGHMLAAAPDETDHPNCKQWHCLGKDHIPKHRGSSYRSQWFYDYQPKHRREDVR